MIIITGTKCDFYVVQRPRHEANNFGCEAAREGRKVKIRKLKISEIINVQNKITEAIKKIEI